MRKYSLELDEACTASAGWSTDPPPASESQIMIAQAEASYTTSSGEGVRFRQPQSPGDQRLSGLLWLKRRCNARPRLRAGSQQARERAGPIAGHPWHARRCAFKHDAEVSIIAGKHRNSGIVNMFDRIPTHIQQEMLPRPQIAD